MATFHRILKTGTLAFVAGIGATAGIADAQSSSDNSAWYRAPTRTSAPAPAPSPAPPAAAPAPRQRGAILSRSGGYISYGGGNTSIIIGRGGYYGGYGRYYWPRDYRYYRRYDIPDTSTLIDLARRYDPALIGADPNAQAPTALELGIRALKASQYDRAITEFAKAADEQRREASDGASASRRAQRLLGIAYAGARQFDEAGKQLTEAFEADPDLRTLPLSGEELFADGLELNSVVSRAVGHAHRSPSYASWFTVAVLMQAQGKNNLANEMIRRAEAAQDAAQSTPPAAEDPASASDPSPAVRERPQDSEADRLRRELQRSTERMLESQRRLEEMKRKQAEAEATTEGDGTGP